MPFNNNLINKIRYTVYTPIYDHVASVLEDTRKQSIDSLHLYGKENILIVGGGTGLDFTYLPNGVNITATDLTPSMVRKMAQRSESLHITPNLMVMDGQHLTFPDNHFDVVLMHLILAVIPNPVKALKEAERVLKPGGKIAVMDKFLPANQNAGIFRQVVNLFTKFMFSDINRKIEEIVATTQLQIISDVPANFGGIFRRIILQKSKNQG